MNKSAHLIIGAVAFLVYNYLIGGIIGVSNNVFFYGLIASVAGSVIPDILEAPTSWMHRGICHSKRALKFTAAIFVITAFFGLFSSFVHQLSLFFIASAFFLGYMFHLIADATTKVGLPA